MLTNIQTLLLGALIGFLASILTTVLNHILEKGRNSQKHTWELEERSQLLRREINNKRLDQVEDYLKARYEFFCQLYDQEADFLFGFKTNTKQFEEIINNIKDSFRKLPAIYWVKNDEFLKSFDELQKLIDLEVENYQRITSNDVKGKLDREKEKIIFQKNENEISKTYSNILSIIDNLRNK
jgi:hypothetical protein